MNEQTRQRIWLPVFLLLLMVSVFLPSNMAQAEAVKAISIGTTDYDNLTIQVYAGGNSVVYYSTDQTTWFEVEGRYTSENDSYVMDISWISDTKEVTLYLKGDIQKKLVDVTLPMKNNSLKVKYDKVEGEFIISEAEDAEVFQWRKNSDYSWYSVDMKEDSASYKEFMEQMEYLRVKGSKIVFRIPQELGRSQDDMGSRPSKEVTVTLSKRGNAPNISVDPSKLYIKTTTAMEYYDSVRKLWIDCTKNMKLEDLMPKVLYKNGSKNASIEIRKAATTNAPYSKTKTIYVEGQLAAPALEDISYYRQNSKLIIQFPKASKEVSYEYVIVKPGDSFEATTAKWATASTTKLITVSASKAPLNSTVYFRLKGTNENQSKKVSLILASEVNFVQVKDNQK